jgi:hypothetical protein
MRAVAFLFFLVFSASLSGQELFFNTPSNLQNLPSTETYHVFQDSKGIIWICTDAGICRYNGSTLTTFTTKDGISENVVLKAYEDTKGRIWFNTLSGYFFYYFNNRFHAIAANEYLKKKCRSLPINSFFVGEQDTLYCATAADTSLIKIAPQDNYRDVTRILMWSGNRFMYTNKAKPGESIMGSGAGGTIDSQTQMFSFLYNTKKLMVSFSSTVLAANCWKGHCAVDGTVYLPQGDELIVIKNSGKEIKHYTLPSAIFCIYTDAERNLWVGTLKQGGFLFRHGDLNSTPVHFLSNLSISSIMVDRENTIWVATIEKGVFQSMNKNLLYLNEKEDQAINFQKGRQALIIAYSSKRIISVLKNDSALINDDLKTQPLFNGLYLRSAFIGEGLNDYFGSNQGTFIKDHKKSKGVFRKITALASPSQIIPVGKDSLFAIDSHVAFLINHGIIVKSLRTPFPNMFILQLKNKKILLTTRNNTGIFEFKNGELQPYLPNVKELKVRINCIAEDDAGNLWLATNEHGLYCYDHEKKLHHFDKIDDKINALVFDDKQQLWAGTNGGLTKLSFTEDLSKLFITRFNKYHGIPNEEIKKLVEFNGKIGCISKDVFFYFDADSLQKNYVRPLTYIDSVFINDKAYDFNKPVVLKYDNNNIHVLTSLISYRNSIRKEYLYQLKGYEQSWHYSATGDIQYTNLPHGTYTFTVFGLNNDKVKSDKPATFTFTIQKPFWLTWWFILLEISIIFIIIYFSIRYWKNKIEKREREKASVNQEISEFKMTALRSQMNPHFIFNAIGSIQHYILKNEVKQSYNYLSKFSMLIRNILNNSRQEYISLTQEINTLRLYIELEQIRFTHPFKFEIEIDDELDMEMDIPTMLIQPYVENSIWHGLMPKESDGMLELLFKKVDDSMLVTIRDNGMGRKNADPAKKNVSRGMSITEQRINILATTSRKKFITTIIDLKDEYGNSKGTEVNLLIPFDL